MEIVFILSHPAVPENIGAAARALKTMGFGKLRLVAPAGHLSTNARKLAHGAGDILEQARCYDTTQEAVADLDFLVGTTAKPRNIRQEYLTADRLNEFLDKRKGVVNTIGILFGSEESGLSNEEITLCDILSYIPLAAPYPSLNLAQAVMLYAWEISSLTPRSTPEEKKETASTYQVLKERTEKLLPLLGIHPARPVYHRIFERLALASPGDIHLLLSVADGALKKIKTQKK
jgi:tRNA/rRNA methyltransferase